MTGSFSNSRHPMHKAADNDKVETANKWQPAGGIRDLVMSPQAVCLS
jgi:hypothetical protein